MITEDRYKELKAREFTSLNYSEQGELSRYENHMIFNKFKNFVKEKAKEGKL